MAYSIELNHEFQFIRYSHSGEIERKEIGEAWREIIELKEFTQLGYNLLTDYRGGVFFISIDEISLVDDFPGKIKHLLKGKRNAVIVDNPNEHVLSMLVGMDKDIAMNYYVDLFSTEEAALNYL